MDDQRTGSALRALRRRRGLRQVDVARAAGLSQTTISKAERGHFADLSVGTLRRAFAAVDVRLDVDVWWRAGDLDRLLDERHAGLCSLVANTMTSHGWDVRSEVTFSRYGERGSIDLLAWRPEQAALLVCEIKTELASVEETLRRLDVKRRLASDIAREALGVRPKLVGRVLVLPERSAIRAAVARHETVLRASLPDRGLAVRSWLDRPAGPLSGIWIVSPGRTPAGSGSRPDAGKRVRRPIARQG